jgi:hypothetical protein
MCVKVVALVRHRSSSEVDLSHVKDSGTGASRLRYLPLLAASCVYYRLLYEGRMLRLTVNKIQGQTLCVDPDSINHDFSWGKNCRETSWKNLEKSVK